MKSSVFILTFIVFSIFMSPVVHLQEPDDCNLVFQGKSRKSVKLRSEEDGAHYPKHNSGEPITIGRWLEFTCSLETNLPSKIPETAPMDVEKTQISLEGYLLGVRFEKSHHEGDGKDNDLHVEIGESSNWNSKHVIVEIPPGDESCFARQSLWKLVYGNSRKKGDQYLLETPPRVVVTGYLFLDAAHMGECKKQKIPFCECNGGRGITKPDFPSQVQGLWEIHPVLKIRAVP